MREPARTPHAARQRYTRILQQSLSCVTKAQWYVGPSPSDDDNLALASSPRSIALHREPGLPRLNFVPSQLFTIIDDVRYAGEYKARTLAYIYSVQLADPVDDGDAEIIAWHWHPLTTPGRVQPHVHVQVDHPHLGGTALSKLHIPTGRVAFEEVLRFLIMDLRVEPVREGWETIVGESEERFKAYRTWS